MPHGYLVNASIVEHFRTLEDPRIERTKKHLLLDILVIAVCTLLTGGEGLQDMELFGKSKRAWLHTFLALPHGIPSHDTFGRVFARLNPTRFQECVLAWTQAVAQLTKGALVSLDGKTVRASFDRATASSPLHMLSAWCSEQGGLVLGQIKTEEKSNEITAFPALLNRLASKAGLAPFVRRAGRRPFAGKFLTKGGTYCLASRTIHKRPYKLLPRY